MIRSGDGRETGPLLQENFKINLILVFVNQMPHLERVLWTEGKLLKALDINYHYSIKEDFNLIAQTGQLTQMWNLSPSLRVTDKWEGWESTSMV